MHLCLKECRCPAPPNHSRRCLNWVVQEAINVLWFRRMNKVCRAAKAYPGGYDVMPIPAVALAITVVCTRVTPDHFCC